MQPADEASTLAGRDAALSLVRLHLSCSEERDVQEPGQKEEMWSTSLTSRFGSSLCSHKTYPETQNVYSNFQI